ncbi:MAG TPA: peptide chain release factor N(5)-glutamine methyltransferase [Geminicoccus sp.]|uniref:peptide chain release factor N(5)-glutamine methyltransferase n=1 Tax=Geminicoccus sp. TaxID=2024832 RepID=UPI002E2F0721|nr:peptide chain release factor N(5)-glutamine methyltransferase [Geminicoccus sp.]HEX2529341.1 peptide chain release factor N(5)-glutamine methyltransferase [Geminicoccus sp.]
MTTVAAALADTAARLAAAGVESPRREAMLLMDLATGRSRMEQLADGTAELPGEQEARLEELVTRRCRREPFAYLAGTKEFYGRPFAVGPGVLVPRPETETLIDAALEARPDRSERLRLLDLGVGSGCLLLTLLAEFPQASGVGVDTSEAALAWARRNAEALGVDDRVLLVQGCWGRQIDGAFDLIVSNPPYIDRADLADLEPELAFEPDQALSPGADGLQAYRSMTPDLLRLLKPSGLVLLEIGRGQDALLADWFHRHGLAVTVRPDLAGIGRCIVLRRAGQDQKQAASV